MHFEEFHRAGNDVARKRFVVLTLGQLLVVVCPEVKHVLIFLYLRPISGSGGKDISLANLVLGDGCGTWRATLEVYLLLAVDDFRNDACGDFTFRCENRVFADSPGHRSEGFWKLTICHNNVEC